MEKYLNNLIEQFKDSTGTKYVDIKSSKFTKEFSEWIKIRKETGKRYLSMLDYMEIKPSHNKATAEIGKGIYDSLFIDKEGIIITPHAYGFDNKIESIVLPAEFKVYKGIPTITGCGENKNDIYAIDKNEIRRFMTQNPYNQADLSKWEDLHNSGESNITVGIYGKTYDKDIEKKIKMLEVLRRKLLDDMIKEEYVNISDDYLYTFSSDRMVKTKKRIFHR